MNLNGQRLREARTAAGLSRAKLANQVDTTESTIKRAENNDNAPRAETLARIALALDVSMESLFDSEPEKVA